MQETEAKYLYSVLELLILARKSGKISHSVLVGLRIAVKLIVGRKAKRIKCLYQQKYEFLEKLIKPITRMGYHTFFHNVGLLDLSFMLGCTLVGSLVTAGWCTVVSKACLFAAWARQCGIVSSARWVVLGAHLSHRNSCT